jgi:hypothetical protein
VIWSAVDDGPPPLQRDVADEVLFEKRLAGRPKERLEAARVRNVAEIAQDHVTTIRTGLIGCVE